jgi:hypothetical protein
VLCNVWKLAPPCAIISMPPSFNRSSLPSHVELIVSRGLAEAALKTNAWIITSGYADGVGAHVAGNALAFAHANLSGSARLCCIGIVPFDGIRGHEALEAVGKNGVVHHFADLALRSMAEKSNPTTPPPSPPPGANGEAEPEEAVCPSGISAKDAVTPILIPPNPHHSTTTTPLMEDAILSPRAAPQTPAETPAEHGASSSPSEQHDLNRHHTHFVMVDGSDAVPFRMKLEKYISDYDISGDEIQTPKVLLVVGGGTPAGAPKSKLAPTTPSAFLFPRPATLFCFRAFPISL